MKTIPIVTILILIIVAIVGMSFQKISQAKNKTTQDSVDRRSKHASAMLGLRDLALKLTTADLSISVSSDSEVYGVVMDWYIAHGVVTLTSFQTGDASIYNTTGQSFLGGGENEKINKAAKQCVFLAQSCLIDAVHTDSTPLPEKDGVNFYLLTGKGIFTKQLTMTFLRNTSSTWRELFNQANDVIHEYDISTRERRKEK